MWLGPALGSACDRQNDRHGRLCPPVLNSVTGGEVYEHARVRDQWAGPGSPAALFSDLAELACIGPGCRVLEIGCGTGQATIPLAERGCEIVCVELGPSLAAVARRKLARFGSVRVEVAAFEAWP